MEPKDDGIISQANGNIGQDEPETGELGARKLRKIRADRGKPREHYTPRGTGASTGSAIGSRGSGDSYTSANGGNQGTGEATQTERLAVDSAEPKEIEIEAPKRPASRSRATKNSETQKMLMTMLRGLANINQARQPDDWLRNLWTIADEERQTHGTKR